MAIKATWFTLSADQQRDLDERAKSPGWRIVGGRDLPAVFPKALREKIDSAVVVAKPTSTGGTYLVYSASRVDYKPQKTGGLREGTLDQLPEGHRGGFDAIVLRSCGVVASSSEGS